MPQGTRLLRLGNLTAMGRVRPGAIQEGRAEPVETGFALGGRFPRNSGVVGSVFCPPLTIRLVMETAEEAWSFETQLSRLGLS